MAEEESKKVAAERSNVSMVAVAWFRPEEWAELKRLCPDLQETYEEWLANAQAGIAGLGSPLREQVVKIVLPVDDLRKWQRSTGRKVDAKARADMASRIARKSHSTRH